MTVRELVAILQGFHPDRRVVVYGYTGGLSDVERQTIYLAKIAINFNDPLGDCGPHEEVEHLLREKDGEDAVVIGRIVQ